MRLTLLGGATALMLLSGTASQTSASTMLALYTGSDFTTNFDPQNIGPRLYAQVWMEFGPSILTPADATGTYTLSDNLHWTDLFNVGNADYFVSSSQGLNFIYPGSSVTFDHGLITSWDIVGNASIYGSGSVRDEDGNILIYSANYRISRKQSCQRLHP
jgi:hypothetical protein